MYIQGCILEFELSICDESEQNLSVLAMLICNIMLTV